MAAIEPPFSFLPMRSTKTSNGGRLLTLNQAAEYLALSHWTLRRLVWRGDLPHVRIGRLVQLDRADLDAWIDSQKTRFGASNGASSPIPVSGA
jgi:excisionase family DNA binding protein